eukprot:6203296-Pleurochrysis_carterae.AAC.1
MNRPTIAALVVHRSVSFVIPQCERPPPTCVDVEVTLEEMFRGCRKQALLSPASLDVFAILLQL